MRKSIILLGLAVALLTGGFRPAVMAQQIPADTALHHGTLPNGFQYFIRYNNEPKSKALLFLVNKAGSILEDEDQQGLAHFMEHMNFNGTKNYPKNALEDFLQRAGVRFGADLNAYTSHDETVYELPIPTDIPGMVSAGLGIVRDWAQDALLEKEQIDKERGVILEEERLGLGKDQRMRKQYLPVLLNGSRYAYRLPIGQHDILKRFRPEQLRRFYRDWYRPNLQAIIVVGDIDVKAVEQEIKQRFSDLKNPRKERPRKDFSIALNGENHFSIVTDPEQTAVSLNILIKHRSSALKTQTDYLNSIKRDLLSEMLSARFNALDQAPEKAFMEVRAANTPLLGGLDAFSFLVIPKQGRLKEAFMQGWRVIEQALRFGFSQTELDRVRVNYKRNMAASLKAANNIHSRNFVQQYQALFLKQTAAPSLQWKADFVQQHVDQIQAEELLGMLKSYVKERDRQYLLFLPEGDDGSRVEEKTVLGWIREVKAEALEPYVDPLVEGVLLPVLPESGRILSESRIDSLNVTVLKLDNGAEVFLKPTTFQENQIVFNGFAPGGSSLSDSANYVSAINSGPMINMMGLGAYKPLELQRLLTGKMVGAGTFIGDRAQGVNGSSTPEDLETALQLLYLRFTAPRKDTVLFKNALYSARQSLAHKYADPNSIFRDTIGYVLGNYHYRSRPFTVDRLAEINLDSAFAFYKARFGDASGFTFVFVGNFAVDSIKPLIATYIGGLPSTGHRSEARDLNIHIPEGRLSRLVKGGTEDRATVQMVVSGAYPYNEANNMGIHFLEQILQMRLLEVLRERAGEVYSPSVHCSYSKYPESRSVFNFSFGCAPENVDHLISLVEQELKTLRDNGPSQADINKVKATYVKQMQEQRVSNSFWLSYLTGSLQNNDDLFSIFKAQALLNDMTPGFLKELSGSVLNGKNLIDFRLVPVDEE